MEPLKKPNSPIKFFSSSLLDNGDTIRMGQEILIMQFHTNSNWDWSFSCLELGGGIGQKRMEEENLKPLLWMVCSFYLLWTEVGLICGWIEVTPFVNNKFTLTLGKERKKLMFQALLVLLNCMPIFFNPRLKIYLTVEFL